MLTSILANTCILPNTLKSILNNILTSILSKILTSILTIYDLPFVDKMNILTNKKSHQCPYQLVFHQLPVSGPHTRQLLCHLDTANEPHSDTDDDSEGAGLGGGAYDTNIISACIKKYKDNN